MSEEKKKGRTENKIIDISKIRSAEVDPEEWEDPEMDELIRESFKREADLLEEELNNDPELMGVGASDDLFLSIVSKLKEQGVWEEEEVPKNLDEEIVENGPDDVETVDNDPKTEETCVKQEDIYRMLPEEDLQALMLGREVTRQKEEKKHRRQRQRRTVRRIASVAAVFVLVCMVGMQSEANRRLVLKAWDAVMTMAGFKVVTNYVDESEVVRGENAEEEKAWKDAEERLGISILDFTYMPEGMKFDRYEVFEESNWAMFMYDYCDRIIEVSILDVSDTSSMYLVNDDKYILVDKLSIDKNRLVEIWKPNVAIEQEMYLAEFEYAGCRYVINGMIELSEIKKIIKNVIFL